MHHDSRSPPVWGPSQFPVPSPTIIWRRLSTTTLMLTPRNLSSALSDGPSTARYYPAATPTSSTYTWTHKQIYAPASSDTALTPPSNRSSSCERRPPRPHPPGTSSTGFLVMLAFTLTKSIRARESYSFQPPRITVIDAFCIANARTHYGQSEKGTEVLHSAFNGINKTEGNN